MEKLLYIDACIRGNESRTKKIATPIIEELKKRYDVKTLIINDLKLNIVNQELINERLSGDIPDYVLAWANTIQQSDRIVISAPFWDMSIPSALKVFIELCSILNVTFKSDNEKWYGNCNCKKLLYITTRGMNIKTRDKLDQATPYFEALSELWGLGKVEVISAYNLDYVSNDEINLKIDESIKEGLNLAKSF